jgi:hypothetical protein
LVNKSSPTQEASLSTNWSLLSSGGSTTQTNGAIKTDGTLWMWRRRVCAHDSTPRILI